MTQVRKKLPWYQSEAVAICKRIEPIASAHGCHVALAGGCLYGSCDGREIGPRKDMDIVFYRSADENEIPVPALLSALQIQLGVYLVADHGYVKKCVVHYPFQDAYEWDVDLLFPNAPGKYPRPSPLSPAMIAKLSALWNQFAAGEDLQEDDMVGLQALQLLEHELNCQPRATPPLPRAAAADRDTQGPGAADSSAELRPELED